MNKNAASLRRTDAKIVSVCSKHDVASTQIQEVNMAIALVAGFLTAIGWWGGNKVTAAIDNTLTPSTVCTAQEQK